VVACVDLDAERAKAVAAEVQAAGGRALRVVGDVQDPGQAQRCVAEAVAELGGVDVCVDIVVEAEFGLLHEQTVPGWVASQPPRATDVADAILFLCSGLAQRITGQTLVVDGGPTTRSPWGFREDQIPALGVNLPTVGHPS
jgi:3-oxoacyl-[acyl-carrier protein] reductase